MAIPTVTVTCSASDQGGAPVAFGVYTAKLDKTEIYAGFVVPEVITVTANSDGVALMNLWPNALGVNSSSYRITARNPDTGRKFFDASVVVPNNPCNLFQIIFSEPYPLLDSAQQALLSAQAQVAIANQDVVLTQQAAAAALQARNEVQAWLAQLQFVPPSIISFLIDGQNGKTLEIGASASAQVLSWTLTGSTPNTQAISNGVGAVSVGTLVATAAGPYTTNQNWVLTTTDTSPNGTPVTATASVSLSFLHRRYWGVSALTSLSSADVLALGDNELSGARGKAVNYNASGGKYPYYAYPASFGPISGVTVNGLPFSDYTTTTVSVTNAFGNTETYYVVRFNSIQNGSNIGAVWS